MHCPVLSLKSAYAVIYDRQVVHTDRQVNGQIGWSTDRQVNGQIGWSTDRHGGLQTGRQTEMQAGRKTG